MFRNNNLDSTGSHCFSGSFHLGPFGRDLGNLLLIKDPELISYLQFKFNILGYFLNFFDVISTSIFSQTLEILIYNCNLDSMLYEIACHLF